MLLPPIERICEECSEHGIANPKYSLHLEDLVVKFETRTQSNAPKEYANAPKGCAKSIAELSELEQLLISIMQNEPNISVKDLAVRLDSVVNSFL